MNLLDRAIAAVAPARAARRAAARQMLAYYEGARPGRQRSMRREYGSPDALVEQGAERLRSVARYLERNHDITRGALRVMVNNVIGPAGIGIEPQPRRKDGTIHAEYAAALREAWRDWTQKPEVTQRMRWPLVQRMMAYSWLRDGEVFAQQLAGPVRGLDHGTAVPYSLELLEADFVPLDYDDASMGIRQGIQCNAWGQPTGYWVHKQDPRETVAVRSDLKMIPADDMLHLATLDRLHQRRGVSELCSIVTRIEDLKDYEESERIAAKIAASLTAYVKRNEANGFNATPPSQAVDANGNVVPRDLRFEPGMVIDTLQVGEEIGLVDASRPNANLIGWRSGQLRAIAAGLGVSYSSIARDYDGTYSAQRQELVEQWVHYAVLTDGFVGMFVQPVWESFVRTAHLSGVVPMPDDVVRPSEDDALFIGQSMPWIDPMKEANAWEKLVQAGFASEPEVIRKRGANPADVLEQTSDWRARTAEKGLVFTSDGKYSSRTTPPPGDGEEPETTPETSGEDTAPSREK